ncbi:hypothetical protein N7494_009942 [Penicillium frequentans]|uniref:Rhodopsin domain-containing protein n=1 Tax=Penicillium frequentans TaxID=3151616 RepID=A0AAD6GC05_9EURO|nr:hypothetical protein N7494_009942 [Penicillium glabrum]
MGTRFKGDTKDPVVNITTWCLLVVMILSVLSRLGTKIRLFRQLIVDDFLIITSLVCCPMCLPKYRLQHQSDTEFSTQVFGVGQSVAVSLAVGSGYGKHLEDLTKDEMDHMMKVIGGTEIYAASLLCTLSLLFSKLSLVIFIRRLTPTCEKRRVGRGVEAMIYAWATVTFFGSAFSCAIPRTFDLWHGHCFNLLAWRYFIGISNIGTELLIIVQATIVMLIIQSWGLRMIFASIFVPRTLVVSAIIAQLAFTRNGVRSADGPYDMCELTIFDAIPTVANTAHVFEPAI